MISNSCAKYLQDNNLEGFITELRYYLSHSKFSRHYKGDVRIRAEWILLNYQKYSDFSNRDSSTNISFLNNQVRVLFDEIRKDPLSESVCDLFDAWKSRNR